MIARTLLLAGIFTSGLLFAADVSEQKTHVTKTERMDFPAGGVLHLKHSIGELTIEGWDEPALELTTIKAPPLRYDAYWNEEASHHHEIEATTVTAERKDNEILVTTTLPHRRSFLPPPPLRGGPGVVMEYRIKVPRSARLIVEHDGGEVHIEGITGEIHATSARGEITLRLPQDSNYAIDAKSDLGDVVSDIPGREHRRLWLLGHTFVPDEPAGTKLYLRTGVGDIVIQKMRKPTPPGQLLRRPTGTP